MNMDVLPLEVNLQNYRNSFCSMSWPEICQRNEHLTGGIGDSFLQGSQLPCLEIGDKTLSGCVQGLLLSDSFISIDWNVAH